MLMKYSREGMHPGCGRLEHFDVDTHDIDEFYILLEEEVPSRVGGDGVIILEMQPGDGTRYRIHVSKTDDYVVVSMSVPDQRVIELRMGIDDPPCPWDSDLARLNPYTAAILADVLQVVWQREPRFYDYENRKPREEADVHAGD